MLFYLICLIRDNFGTKLLLFFYICKFYTKNLTFCNVYFAKYNFLNDFYNFYAKKFAYLWNFVYLCAEFVTF